jgi:hypothetical protein
LPPAGEQNCARIRAIAPSATMRGSSLSLCGDRQQWRSREIDAQHGRDAGLSTGDREAYGAVNAIAISERKNLLAERSSTLNQRIGAACPISQGESGSHPQVRSHTPTGCSGA